MLNINLHHCIQQIQKYILLQKEFLETLSFLARPNFQKKGEVYLPKLDRLCNVITGK